MNLLKVSESIARPIEEQLSKYSGADLVKAENIMFNGYWSMKHVVKDLENLYFDGIEEEAMNSIKDKIVENIKCFIRNYEEYIKKFSRN